MSHIPLSGNTEKLFMAGEDPCRIWYGLYPSKGDVRVDIRTVFFRYGGGSPARGCDGCTDPDCPCEDFIRRYRNHPRCD